jgi:hypothetical protein
VQERIKAIESMNCNAKPFGLRVRRKQIPQRVEVDSRLSSGGATKKAIHLSRKYVYLPGNDLLPLLSVFFTYLWIVFQIIVSLQIQWLHPCEQVVAGLDRRSETKLRRRLIS